MEKTTTNDKKRPDELTYFNGTEYRTLKRWECLNDDLFDLLFDLATNSVVGVKDLKKPEPLEIFNGGHAGYHAEKDPVTGWAYRYSSSDSEQDMGMGLFD